MGLVQSIVDHLRQWLKGGLPFDLSPTTHLDLGQRGEVLAARHLNRHGYKVLWRNYRAPHGGEVDLVCRDKKEDVLVFVEVKTRSSSAYGRPILAVDREKQTLIARGALAWLRLLGNPEIKFRFDVVEIIMEEGAPQINVVQNAFALPAPYIY